MNKDVEEVLSRSVASFIDPGGAFKKKLEAKARKEHKGDIVIKLGVDPSRPDIHLGHTVVLRKLRQFQDLGCMVVFVIGDFTARIGDPEGKSKTRPELEQEEVKKNAKTYIDQVGKILKTDDPKLFSWIRNSDWFTNITDLNLPDDYKIEMNVEIGGKSVKTSIPPNSVVGKAVAFEKTRMQTTISGQIRSVTPSGLLWTLRHITHSKLIGRDMFQERIKNGEELYMHEMLYPVFQGTDSYIIAQVYGSCDLEIGGTDQTFNMLIGRDAMKANNVEPQAVMALDILPGLDGKEKMSKSLGNYVTITESSSEMFGKIMSIPDKSLVEYFKLATYTSLKEIEDMKKKLKSGKLKARDVKMRLAREVVSIYHGEEAAKDAEGNFVKTFSGKGVPKDVETVKSAKGAKLVDVLLSKEIVESKTEWRRLVQDGAVTNMDTGEKVSSPDETIEKPVTLKVGKHRFLKIEVL